MLIKSVVLFLVAVAVQSATLSHGRNIPVEVRYERLEHDFTSNLAEKVQLNENELQENEVRLINLKAAAADEPSQPEADHSHLIKNLDEKVQLSQEELQQSTKHLPLQNAVKDEVVPELAPTTAERPSQLSLIEGAENVFQTGLEYIKNNFVPKDDEQAPSPAMWEKLEKNVKEYFQDAKNKFSTRQSEGTTQQNIFQNVVNGFQNLTNNFIQQLPGQRPQNASSDESSSESSNPFQGFVNYFTGGVQSMVQNIQNIGQNASGQQVTGNSTVLGDSPSQQQPPQNIFGNFVSGIQQFFGQGSSTPNATQSDSNSQGFFAGAVNQFNNAINNINNIIPTSSQQPPAAQGDDTSATTGSSVGPVQQVFNQFGNIGTAFNNFIQGGQNKPQGSEDETSSQAPSQNFIQSIGQNLGSAFQNIQNQFRPPTVSGSTDNNTTGSSNPIVGQISNIGNQIQQAAAQNPIQSLIPGSSSSLSSSEAATESSQKKKEEEPVKVEEEKKEPMIAIA